MGSYRPLALLGVVALAGVGAWQAQRAAAQDPGSPSGECQEVVFALLDEGSSGGCIAAADLERVMFTRQEATGDSLRVTTYDSQDDCEGADFGGSELFLYSQVAITDPSSEHRVLQGAGAAVDWIASAGDSSDGVDITKVAFCEWRDCDAYSCYGDAANRIRFEPTGSGNNPACFYRGCF